jgi:predicted Zn-dependent peptidase
MRAVTLVALGWFLLLATGLVKPANAAYDINLDVKEFRLENGMLFLVVERPVTPQVACRLAIRAGSALEEAGKTGIAHMLEHMMFKGTKNFGTLDYRRDEELQQQIDAAYRVIRNERQRRSPDQDVINAKLAEMERLRQEVQNIYVPQAFSAQLGENGAVGVNAFTTKDQTQFVASVPSDMIEQWFSIVSEQLFEPSWREFYVEKEVVQREWAYRYINDPNGAAWLDLDATAYTAHPYRNPTIGWKSDMENYSTQDAIDFHRRFYNPTNAVCVLVGDITVDQAQRLAGTYFARYPAGRRAPETVTREPPQEGPRRSIRYLPGARTPLVRIGFHGAQMGTADFYALDAMTMILSQGESARMTQEIVNTGGAIEAWAYNPDNRYGGMVILGGSANEPGGLTSAGINQVDKRRAYLNGCEVLEKVLLAEVDRMKAEAVTARELERIKKLNRRDFLDRMRSNEDLAGTLATLEVQVGWRYLINYLDNMDKVTPQDIQRVARQYIDADNQTSVYIIPGGEPEQPPEMYSEIRSISGSAANRPHYSGALANHSDYPTPEGWKHPLSFARHPEKIIYPEAQKFSVASSEVFYLPDHQLPLIDLTLLVKAGEVDVAAEKQGLGDLLESSLIRGGTESHSPQELALALDENAIQISISVGEEDTSIRLSVIKDDWDKGLSLLQEILTRPRFDPAVLQVAKQQLLIGLQRQGEDGQAVAMREAMIWHFKDHPYGRDPLRGLETIPNLSDKDLRRFLATYVVSGNIIAAVAGDIERKDVEAGLTRLLQGLPDGPAPQRQMADPKDTPPVLTLIHKPGQVQSQVIVALPGLKRIHPDYWKASLLMNVFGGSDSLMYTRLRDDLGLVYSAYFYQTYKWQAGYLMGYIGCKGDQTSAAIRETVNIMKSLKQGVPDKELEQKRLDALNSFVFNVDTPIQLVEVYGRYFMRREPLDTLERIQDAYISATPDELRRLADELFDLRRLQVFVVGDKNIRVENGQGGRLTLENGLKQLSADLGLPYQEIELR